MRRFIDKSVIIDIVKDIKRIYLKKYLFSVIIDVYLQSKFKILSKIYSGTLNSIPKIRYVVKDF